MLQISRSSHYYRKVPQSNLNLNLMRLIDEEFLNRPWKGVPRMTNWLQKDMGYAINKKRVERLYRVMGLSASAPGPATSKKGKGKKHKIFPYLLRNLKITAPNQVWAIDITYIPVQGGLSLSLRGNRSVQQVCGRLEPEQHDDFGMVPRYRGDGH
ncbi:IS3 family transposase [Kaistella daneshvariae]|uniref:IS3 family transposase n=2 Tax=Kaistella TaxID=2782231 RepID=UPI0016079C59|nr:IS3 family transposase [Kaistella daneshvariae]